MESESKPERTLSDLFTEGFNGLEAVTKSKEATNSSSVQVQLRHAITALEDCTRLVSATGMFSSNENIDEVSSINIRYLLLPALLGQLSLQIASDATGRLDVVLLAEAYFKDYLRRCRDYGVVEHDQVASILDPEESSDNKIVAKTAPKGADLAAMVQTRNDKIKRHQQQKEMESQMCELKEAASHEGADDETVRKYHMLLLRINVAQALEELSSLAMEKNILQHMARLKKESSGAEEIDESQRPPSRKPPPRKSLQPVIITRDETMKAVFGAGYPSLPVLTVAEFYEQRVKDGIFPGGCSSHASGGPSQGGGVPVTEETEAEMQEQQEEADNPELIARRRAMDEYKDDHRRGEGNRHNRS